MMQYITDDEQMTCTYINEQHACMLSLAASASWKGD